MEIDGSNIVAVSQAMKQQETVQNVQVKLSKSMDDQTEAVVGKLLEGMRMNAHPTGHRVNIVA